MTSSPLIRAEKYDNFASGWNYMELYNREGQKEISNVSSIYGSANITGNNKCWDFHRVPEAGEE